MALGRKTGGRKKGTLNKRTRARLAVADRTANQGITPLEVMVATMRALWARARNGAVLRYALAAERVASDAAPYIHPRLATAKHEHSGSIDGLTLDERRALLEAVEALGTSTSEARG